MPAHPMYPMKANTAPPTIDAPQPHFRSRHSRKQNTAGDPVEQHPPPVQEAKLEVAVAQRHGEQRPVERVRDPGLHLADQRLAGDFVRRPQWDAAGMPLARFVLEPGARLQRLVGILEPGVAVAERVSFQYRPMATASSTSIAAAGPHQSSCAGASRGESFWKMPSAIRYAQPPKTNSGR